MATASRRGHTTRPAARAHSAGRAVVPSGRIMGSEAEDLFAQLDRATAALWLLDQVQYGELCFLTMRGPSLPCWASAPAAHAMRPEDVAGWLQDMGLKTLAEALAEAKRLAPPPRRGG